MLLDVAPISIPPVRQALFGFAFFSGCLSASGPRGGMQAVGQGGVLALGEKRGVLGDGLDQRLEPFLVGLGEVVQHVMRHRLLDAGMADADAQAAGAVAERRID